MSPGPVSDALASLSEQMRSYARQHPEHADELERYANALDAACEHPVDPRKLLGTWARARKFWCELTGRDLV